MRAEVNGRLIEQRDGATVADFKKAAGVNPGESMIAIEGRDAREVSDSDLVRNGQKLRSSPTIVQG
jgi:hypothetical protein